MMNDSLLIDGGSLKIVHLQRPKAMKSLFQEIK